MSPNPPGLQVDTGSSSLPTTLTAIKSGGHPQEGQGLTMPSPSSIDEVPIRNHPPGSSMQQSDSSQSSLNLIPELVTTYAPYRSPRLNSSSAPSPNPSIDTMTSTNGRRLPFAEYDLYGSPSLSPSPTPSRAAERDELLSVLEAIHRCEPTDLTTKLHLGGHIHRLLVEGSHGGGSKDDFREAGGFLVVVQLLSSLESTSPRPASKPTEAATADEPTHNNASETEQQDEMHERLRVEIFKIALSITAEAMDHHPANVKAFNVMVGWDNLKASIRLSTIGTTSPDHLFAALLGLSLGDVSTYSGRLSSLRKEIAAQGRMTDEEMFKFINVRIAEQWSASIRFAPAAAIALELAEEQLVYAQDGHLPTTHVAVYSVVKRLSEASKRNQVLLAEAKVGSQLLSLLLGTKPLAPMIRTSVLAIVRQIFALGIPEEDGRIIFQELNKASRLDDHALLDLLLEVSPASREPNTVNFAMAEHGHASMAFSTLRRPFPPGPASKGLTLIASFCIERIEPSLPLELVSLFDAQRTCSLRLTIEPGTGQLNYSTMNDPPPIRFKAFRFSPGQRYHIVLAHARPKGGAKTSIAQLFVDGVLVEERLAPWPVTPPHLGSPVRAVFGSPPSSQQKLVGYDRDHRKRVNRLVWSLGPTWLIDDLIAPDLPLVLHQLGPRYASNAQDSLGRFLTYKASTQINLRLDTIARSAAGGIVSEKELAKHPLVTAIAGKSCDLVQEDRLYFVLNSANTANVERMPQRSSSSSSSSHAMSVDPSHRPGPRAVLNQALPLTKEAMGASFGMAKLYGEPALVTPKGVDELVWKLGGSAVLLKLISKSDTSESLSKTLSLFFELVLNSWRLSEDVERSKGYEVLGLMMQSKAHLVDRSIMGQFFTAVGIDSQHPEEAALTNPFLYRIVMLDFDLWRRTSKGMQQAHLQHFGLLLRTSRHRRFNVKRVAKMQIVKKIVYALRSTSYPSDTLGMAVEALRAAVISSYNEASIRAVTCYLASELCKGPENPLAPPTHLRASTMDVGLVSFLNERPSHLTVAAGGGEGRADSGDKATNHGSMDAPVKVFEMLSELISDRPAYLDKFAEYINIKWLLLFFHPRADKRAAVLALDLLSKLLRRPGLHYAERLTMSGGFKVLERLLPRFWSTPSVMALLWSTLLGLDRAPNTGLYTSFAPSPEIQEVTCPPVLRAIISCFKEGLRATAARDNEPKRRATANKGRPSGFLEPLETPAKSSRHMRKRSQSLNIDTKTLQETFRVSSEQALLSDTVRLIEAHSTSIRFRELLFSPIILRGLIDAVFPFVEAPGEARSGHDVEVANVVRICNSALDLLSHLAVDSVLTSHSAAILDALVSALPPSDLTQQSNFRRALHGRIITSLRSTLEKSPQVVFHAADALAAFVETSSDEVLNGSPLEDSLFGTITAILSLLHHASSPAPTSGAINSLLLSLNRILLYRLTLEKDILHTFKEITEWQTSVFLDANKDSSFFECLQNRVFHYMIHGEEEEVKVAAFDVLKLMTLSRPAVTETILAEGKTIPDLLGAEISSINSLLRKGADGEVRAPYGDSWQGFYKSRETLRAAAHLERVQQLHEMLRRVDTREQSVVNTENRMVAWHSSLCEAENARYAKFVNDAREMSTFAGAEWRKLLLGLERERAIFGKEEDAVGERLWKLDATEGPCRARIKLQELPARELIHDDVPYRTESVVSESVAASPVELQHGDTWGSGDAQATSSSASRDVESPSIETQQPPSSISLDVSAEPGEAYQEDKYRRVLRSLDRGDIIEAVFNTSRVVGIESRGCLLILGKTCIYLMDDYFQRPNGELINVWEAPPEERDTLVMATLSSDASRPSGLIAQLEGDAQTRKWPWSAVQICHQRSWLHRRTAVEIFFEDGQSCLLVCRQTSTATKVYQELKTRATPAVAAAEALRDGIRESSLSSGSSSHSLSSRLAGAVLGRSQQWGALTTAWRERRLSNFAYLMELNTLAGRSMNDLTQFPCFPWVLADYTSKELDLENPASFRKFELPMGAQTPVRRREFEERYGQLVEVDMEPFHYGTHYSTAATVCGYMIRMRPFERLLIALQGGNFDLADRTFSSVGRAWLSASELSRGDVRELIPEFFYLPEFLLNSNRFDFGVTQAGETIDQVELPPWAHGDPRLFIQKHREALESDYVSMRLHSWIDLIFGNRSRGREAVESTNVFHPLSYEDAVDLDSIESSIERQATAQVIHNFGQTPSRLFSQPHPQRFKQEVLPTLEVGERLGFLEHIGLVIQSIAPIRTLKSPVHFIYPFHPERAFASPKDYLILPKLGVSLSYGHLDGSVRMFGSKDTKRPLAVTEQMTAERITCIAQARPKAFVTGGADGLVSVWSIDVDKREIGLSQVLRGHTKAVLCVTASPAWSVVVSGSQDQTAIIWDLNRGIYVRSLRDHDSAVHLVAVDESSGHIATGCGPGVRLWSINGELLALVATSTNISEPVSSLGFYERDWHKDRLAVLLTGHRGKVIAWECVSNHASEKEGGGGGDEDDRNKPSSSSSASSNKLEIRAGHGRSRSKSSVSSRTSKTTNNKNDAGTSKSRWKLEVLHVFEHEERVMGATTTTKTKTPMITSLRTTRNKLFTGDELGRLYLWSLVGEAVGVPEAYSANCMNQACSKRFGVLEARRGCSGCGGLFCNPCAPVVAIRVGTTGRLCSHCRSVCDSGHPRWLG
ncbi:beach-domain-containing protein [Violaceomyces palustris]|uniref:Beach-domain-containing protein n=1 Tax=Violaceomyces palustris TaxID=1673888 RepID=A0ACD0NU58_9BASI|nr:beach-domain-containing protein [Violaceomyces palustris]